MASVRCYPLEAKLAGFDGRASIGIGGGPELAIERLRGALLLRFAEGKAETIKWVVGVGFAQVAMILAVLRLFPSVHP